MRSLKKSGLLISLFGLLVIYLTPVQAAMVTTAEVLQQPDRAQLVNLLERQEVQAQLKEMGVDPVAALARVEQMTDEEVVQLSGQLAELPAGAGIGTVNLLLIIIIIILLV